MANIRIYLACAATAMCSSVAAADALHGFCTDCGGSGSTGVVSAVGPLTDFGFWDAGKKNSGTYFIDILTPDNRGASAPSGTFGISGGASGTAALFSSKAWTGGKLDSYLGIQASPSNPLSAWLHATHVLDPKAMGYWVFQADLGVTALGTASGTGPLLKLNSILPPGSVVVAFLETNTSHPTSHGTATSRDNGNDNDQGNENDQGSDNDQGNDNDNDNGNSKHHGKGKNSNSFTATANSSALFETAAGGSTGQQSTSQPVSSGSTSVKPTTPTTVTSPGHGVPEPGTAALVMTALFGFAMRILPWRAASRLTLPPAQRHGK